ncbi:18022_t:CDS:2 [Acaulospora morrowiae]|uniref:18022_t:CDS:1 n=1 Tax=Acaulospora morrowiae TaxID=94023 RepID=A0A9N8YJW6_9GLOM|nr:18022_t:CDS:2 [Acaulospora morrowiae]
MAQTTYVQQTQVYQGTQQMQGGQTVIVQESVTYGAQPRGWKFGLFDCFADVGLSLKTWCCPCITYGETKSKVANDPGSCTTHALIFCVVASFVGPCVMGFLGRGEIRARYNIVGSAGEDFLTHWCCGCCALVQESREVSSP